MSRRLIGLAIAVAAATLPAAHAIPPHPDALVFPPLEYRVPDPADFRRELPGGLPVFMAPSAELPLVTLQLHFRGGAYLVVPETAGLGAVLGTMLRFGGTETLTPEAVDRRLDDLATDVRIEIGRETSVVTLDCLARNLDESFALLMDMLRTPRFDEDRLRLRKATAIERFAHRHDTPDAVLRLELGRLLYGPDHVAGRQATAATIDAIDRAALEALHARIFHPGNLAIAVAGDFRPGAVLSMLATAVDGWAVGDPVPTPSAPTHAVEPGLYHAPTPQAQPPHGVVAIARACALRDDPDAPALEVANQVLGGSMTSRLAQRVRSVDGPQASASSRLQPFVHFPGPFLALAQLRSAAVADATALMLEEMRRLRTDPVLDTELATARRALVDALPQRFASSSATLATFARDALTGRPNDHWARYRASIEAVTAEDVLRVAKAHLDPTEMAILVVGDWEAIETGDPERPTRMSDIRDGAVVHLPRRNPVTLEEG